MTRSTQRPLWLEPQEISGLLTCYGMHFVETLVANIVSLHTAFPDFKMTFVDLIAIGDKTWAHMMAQGTHRGQFMGMPPTGKSFAITVIDICRFDNGKIAEHWGVADRLSLMRQIGASPRPPC